MGTLVGTKDSNEVYTYFLLSRDNTVRTAHVSSTRVLRKIHETTTDRPDRFIGENLDPCLVRACFCPI
jgi:hypothetical protein